MRLPFSKYEGLGNDFVVVSGTEVAPDLAHRLCDRHRGVGADGVLAVDGLSMRVVNSDGSRPEMCGNGLRCVALHLVREGVVTAGHRFTVATDSGPHECLVENSVITVEFPSCSIQPEALPVLADQPLVNTPFEIQGRTLHATAVSMGNPHVVFFDDVGEARQRLGPAVGADSRFPEGVNVGFATAVDGDPIVLSVFERGAGWTRACGTGACAAAVAAVETGRRKRLTPIAVALPGGDLEIVVGATTTAGVRMRGPAHHVFDGVIDLDALAPPSPQGSA